MNGIKVKELYGIEPMSREALVVLVGEVKAELIGVGDSSVLLDFSSCGGPKTTRRYVQEWVRDRGLTSFTRPQLQLWVVVAK